MGISVQRQFAQSIGHEWRWRWPGKNEFGVCREHFVRPELQQIGELPLHAVHDRVRCGFPRRRDGYNPNVCESRKHHSPQGRNEEAENHQENVGKGSEGRGGGE